MNNQDMTIRIITEEAKEVEASVISLFEIKETGNKYAIYTFNEEDAQSLVKIYASRISEIDGLYNFSSIADSEEWGRIKAIMKYMAKDNNDGSDNGSIELIPASQIKAQMNEPISVNLSETKAAKIGPNYKSGITNNYLNNVKNVVVKPVASAVEPTVEPVVIPSIPVEPTPIEVTPVEIPSVEEPEQEEVQPMVDNSAEENVVPSLEQALEMPDIKIPTPIFEPTPITEDDIASLELPKPVVEDEVDELPRSVAFDLPKFNVEIEESKEEVEETSVEVEEEKPEAKEMPSVDSVLNKASYYQNIEEPESKRDESNENIIQSIGLEFMKKVSELAEYEKDLNKRNRELDQKERLIAKLEKELAEKDESLKNTQKSNKDKEMELRKFEKELADRDNDLNRRIMEFNKKISMFQQTFETISKVD